MIRFAYACAVLALTAPAAFAQEAKKDEQSDSRKFTAERVFDLEFARDPQVSPDGRTIVYARTSMDKMTDRMVGEIWSIDTRTGAHRPLITGEGSIASPRWSPSGDRLLYLGAKDGKMQLRVLFMDSGESFSLAQLPENPSAPEWSPDGKFIAFSMFIPSEAPSFAKPPQKPEGAEWSKPVRVFNEIPIRFDGRGYKRDGKTQVFVVSAEGGTPRQITHGVHDLSNPVWVGNDTVLVVGNEAADAELDPIESDIYAVKLSDLSMRPLTTRDGPDHSPAVSPDGKRIAFLGYDDKLRAYQQTDLYVMNADGSNVTVLTADYDHPIGSVQWTGSTILAQAQVNGELEVLEIASNGNISTLIKGVGGAGVSRPYAGGSFSASRNGAVAYTAGSPDRPSEVGFYQPGLIPALNNNRQGTVLTSLNSDILPYLDMAKIEEIHVKSSADGREIEAWVALPHGFKADGSYPMILEIHGGPFSMYGPFFAAEVQRYAAEGYVVVYANPRGSTGYSEEFAQLIDRAYPGNDYDDLISVVDAVIAKNYVDPNRLFVTGGSGGGVLTAWIVGKTDRFAAAVSVKPVINWLSLALSSDIGTVVRRNWIRADPWADPETYWKLSPLSLVANVKTPTMLMVGEEDYRTPSSEAEQYYTALKLLEVDTAFVRVPGSPHNISGRPGRLISKTDTIMGWFKKYDPANKDAESGEEDGKQGEE